MPAWSRVDDHAQPRRRPGTAVSSAWILTIALVGQVLGGIVGIVEAPRHRGGVAVGVARTDEPDDEDRDPLVAWPLLGMVVGGAGGMVTVLLARGVQRVRRRLSTSVALDSHGARR